MKNDDGRENNLILLDQDMERKLSNYPKVFLFFASRETIGF